MALATLQSKPRGKYYAKKLSDTQSQAAVRILIKAMARVYPARKTTAEILGCSLRSAGRLLSKKNPYSARLSKDWAQRICAYTGHPISDVIDPSVKSHSEALLGWCGIEHQAEAYQAAQDLATTVAWRAFTRCGLSGSVIIDHLDGWPQKVTVTLCHSLEFAEAQKSWRRSHFIKVVADTSGKKPIMYMRHHDPRVGFRTEAELTVGNLEKILRDVHKSYKKLPAQLVRESARRPSDSRG